MTIFDQNKIFGGDKKIGWWLLQKPEKKFVDWLVPHLPHWIKTYHLTLASIPISLLIIFCGYLGHTHGVHWLWWISLLIFLQWLTDSLDGAVGRAQNEGLIRWGYYMDHLLDYFFLSSVLITYMLIIPEQSKLVHFMVLVIGGGFMVNSYLAFSATNQFRISYFGIGATEARIVLIALNTLIILFEKTYLAFALPYALGLAFLGLIAAIFQTHRHLWHLDKNQLQSKSTTPTIKN
ncbi:CDP-alcohol phosphatidyltransferase family protein [Patescibacteria group bacterium]|nr:CDP-alcohol phosphatidyltransferase family protein [Patescibacteria group bacterium]MBU1028802.1 CDP-alcohol phosphatidyltransferase family protein [Patescibacteria group bacterium]MBU1915833.1 CDP-alcohol phosphatidyltransferase family protein [Patescibacteria group bacterium]